MSAQELYELAERAELTAPGEAKIELLEGAVRLADTLGDLESGFELRTRLMEAANEWGRPEVELVAFAWCLAQYDRDPELFEDEYFGLMWSYKRVLGCLSDFPQMSRVRIEAAFADFRARLEADGEPLSTYFEFWLRHCIQNGLLEGATEAYRAFKTFTRPADLDCRACQLQRDLDYRVFIGDTAGAIQAAKPLLAPRAPRCNRIPHATHAALLLPLLREGQLKEAAEHHHNYRKIRSDEGFVRAVALHLEFLGYLGDLGAGVALLESHLGWAFRTPDLASRFELLRSSLPLLARLRSSGEHTLKARFERIVPFWNENGEYLLEALEHFLRSDLQALAAQFDARNENGYFSSRLVLDAALLERPAQVLPTLPEPVPKKKPGNAGKKGKG